MSMNESEYKDMIRGKQIHDDFEMFEKDQKFQVRNHPDTTMVNSQIIIYFDMEKLLAKTKDQLDEIAEVNEDEEDQENDQEERKVSAEP